MRKKILSVLLVALMLLPTASLALEGQANTAETLSDAKLLEQFGILRGESKGVNDEYLKKDSNRLQAAIMFLRLQGKEAEAKAFTGKDTFKDADKAQWAEGKNILAYLKAHPEYGFSGYTDGNFGVTDTMLPQQLYKVLLQALGYKQDSDFKFADVSSFAASNGLSKIASVTAVTNKDFATATVEALKSKTKDGSMLAQQLINQGSIPDNSKDFLLGRNNIYKKYENIEKQVLQNQAIELPKEIARIWVYKDGKEVTRDLVAVTWDSFSTKNAGTLTVNGKAGDDTVTATIVVEAAIQPAGRPERNETAKIEPNLSATIQSVDATTVNTLVLNLTSGNYVQSIDKTKVKFFENLGDKKDIQLNVTDAVIQDATHIKLTVSTPLKENAKCPEGDLGVYFDADAFTFTNGAKSLAISKGPFIAQDRIAPSFDKIMFNSLDKVFTVYYNEKIFVNEEAKPAFEVKDKTDDKTLFAGTDYTVTTVPDEGTIKIKLVNVNPNHQIWIGLTSGEGIHDGNSNQALPFPSIAANPT